MRFVKLGCLLFIPILSLFFLFAVSSAENAPVSLSRGLEFFQAGNYEDARNEFNRLIQADPSNAKSHYYLGLALSKLDNYSQAVPAFEKALELDPRLNEVFLSLGIAYYKVQSLNQAILVLNKALKADPRNSSAHFFLGLVYQGQQKYQESIPYFKKAGELDRDFNQLAWYNIGQAHYQLKESKQARDAFQRTLDADPKSDTAKGALQFLEILARQEKSGKRWNVETSAAWEFDDNVTRVEQDVISNVGDFSVNLGVLGEYKLIDKPKHELNVGYDFFQSIFQDLTEFNFQSHALNLSGSYDGGDWDTGLDYSYTYNILGNEQFLGLHSISPSFGFSLVPGLYTSISYIFQDKTFFKIQDRDAHNHSIGFDQFLFFMDNKAYISFGYRLDAEDTSGDQFEYIGHALNSAFQYTLPFQTRLRLSYRFRNKDFSNITPSIEEERKDDKQTFGLVLTKKLFKYMDFKLDYQFIRASSNLQSVDFDENIIQVGFVFPL